MSEIFVWDSARRNGKTHNTVKSRWPIAIDEANEKNEQKAHIRPTEYL